MNIDFIKNVWNKYQLFFFEEYLSGKKMDRIKTITHLTKINGSFPSEPQKLILQNICNCVQKTLLLSEPIHYYKELEKVNPKTFEKLMNHYKTKLKL